MYQEEITIVNIHVFNVGAHNFIQHTLLDLKTQIETNTVIVGDFNAPLLQIDKSYR
jgi:endonuclease/exonuclease/phosphatase family metal-dependent hydrolase